MDIEDELLLDDDLDIIEIIDFGFPRRNYQREEYFDLMDNLSFFKRFRLTKQTTLNILEQIEEELEYDNDLNKSVSPMNQLLATLRFFACGTHQDAIGDFMGMHQTTASRLIKKVAEAIARLRHMHIQMPTGNEIIQVQNDFYQLARFPGVVGCIDGTLIKIKSPGGADAEIYRDRKSYFSLNTQVVCDKNLKIRDVVVRWPGSVLDLTIFNHSRLRARIEGGEFPNSVLLDTCADPQHNEYEIPQGKPPAFVTPGQTYRIASGATVILPCRITQPGSYVLAWKRGIAVLTAGPVKVSPDPRLRVLPSPTIESPASSVGGVPELSGGGYSLELRDVRPQDAGDYICQLGTIEPKEIVHTLEVLVPARIHFVSHSGSVEVTQGQMVKMECRASGNPVPTVSWTRKNNVMPSGERNIQGLTMVIQHADRHTAGQYQCSADNGVGEPDTKHININVLYPPEVEVERTTVHTGIGLEAQLVCIVYAEPSAQVLWYKETTQLGTTEQHATQARGNRYTLTIRNVSLIDMGNYSCVASNMHGKSRGHIFLTGTATTAAIDSPSMGTEREKYTLSWQQPRHHQGHHHRSEESNEFRNTRVNGTRLVGMKPEWISMNIAGPGVINPNYPGSIPPPYPGVTKQKMAHTIQNLQAATTYEVRVQAKNDQGWNKLSPVFHFTTRANDMENLIEPSAQPAVYGSNQGQGLSSNQIRPLFAYGLYVVSFCVFLLLN